MVGYEPMPQIFIFAEYYQPYRLRDDIGAESSDRPCQQERGYTRYDCRTGLPVFSILAKEYDCREPSSSRVSVLESKLESPGRYRPGNRYNIAKRQNC